MSTPANTIEALVNQEYKYGFVTEIEEDTVPRGLNFVIIRLFYGNYHVAPFIVVWGV